LNELFEFDTHHGTRTLSVRHRNKENEPRHRVTIENPYVTRKRVSTARPMKQNSNLKQAPRSSITKDHVSRSSTKATTSKASNTSLDTIEEEKTSPIIR